MRVVVIALLVLVASARADDLAEAKRLEAALEYEPALVIVEKAIAAGGSERERVVDLHLWAGRLAAGLDRVAVAEDHFARVLAIAPATTLPDGTSPKLTAPFDAARARTVPLRVTARVERGVATITVDADPLKLVAGLAVRFVDGREQREPQGRRIEIADGARVTEVAALDAFGNRVWAAPNTKVYMTQEQAIAERPFHRRAEVWGISAGVFAAIGGFSGWRFIVAQDQWQDLNDAGADYTDLRAVELRGRRWGWSANISLGLCAASIVGLIFVGESSLPIHLAEGPGTTGLAVGGEF